MLPEVGRPKPSCAPGLGKPKPSSAPARPVSNWPNSRERSRSPRRQALPSVLADGQTQNFPGDGERAWRAARRDATSESDELVKLPNGLRVLASGSMQRVTGQRIVRKKHEMESPQGDKDIELDFLYFVEVLHGFCIFPL